MSLRSFHIPGPSDRRDQRPKSNLDLVNECDNFPYYSDDPGRYQASLSDYYQFRLQGCDACLGYVPSGIAKRMPITEHWRLDEQEKQVVFQPQSNTTLSTNAVDHRNTVLAQYLQDVRDKHIFKVLDGWRSELYPIYGPNREHLFSMERSATPLFGVVSYGVHMTGFVRTDQGMKIWAPRRAETKQTYPGMMDNTVAGGLSTGEQPFNCVVREAEEEASLPENVVRTAKICGTLTYFHVRDARAGGEIGLCQPECQYLYDLELPPDVVPEPNDNEAVDFQLLTVEETQKALAAGRFKPNCALVLLEFFIRHGILTPENEPDYIEIVARLHRKFEFPTK